MSVQTGEIQAYIGTWSQDEKEGIHRFRLDSESGHLEFIDKTAILDPFHMALSSDRRFLYSTQSREEFQGQAGGAVSAFAIDPDSGALSLLNEQPSRGAMPCYVCPSQDNTRLIVANYNGGSVSLLPIEADGRLGAPTHTVDHQGSGPDEGRQQEPHPHSFLFGPSDRYAFSADLGADRIFVYEVAANRLDALDPVVVQPGAGPRHMTFHPNGKIGYLINELDSTVNVYDYDAETGSLTEIQSITTLPEGYDEPSFTADVQVHPSEKFLYGTNRGHDSLMIFSIDSDSGLLSPVGREPTRGAFPWNIAIDPTGQFIVSANTNGSNLAVFRIDEDRGLLQPVGDPTPAPKPTCVRMLQL